MLRAFTFVKLRFVLQPERRVTLHPANPGNTLRGAFGATFKRLVCPTPAECRQACRMKAVCPYGLVFEPSPPPDADCLRLNQDIPRPFVIRPVPDSGGPAEERTPFTFDLHLVGRAIDYFPYFLITFRELGEQGLGPRRDRYTLAEVKTLHSRELDHHQASDPEVVYCATDQLVRPPRRHQTYDDCRRLAHQLLNNRGPHSASRGPQLAASDSPSTDGGLRSTDGGQRLTIHFLTPTHIKAGGTLIKEPDFHHLVKRLRDRVNALAAFYCEDRLAVDHKGFGERAETVRTISSRVTWQDRSRRSWKTGHTHDMGGISGSVTYEGRIEEFLPLLLLGEDTHVGKYAVWGHGQYLLHLHE